MGLDEIKQNTNCSKINDDRAACSEWKHAAFLCFLDFHVRFPRWKPDMKIKKTEKKLHVPYGPP